MKLSLATQLRMLKVAARRWVDYREVIAKSRRQEQENAFWAGYSAAITGIKGRTVDPETQTIPMRVYVPLVRQESPSDSILAAKC